MKKQASNSLEYQGTFNQFAGPIRTRHLNSACSISNLATRVMSNVSSRGTTSGCFVEKSADGKSRAFELDAAHQWLTLQHLTASRREYYRSISVWQGFLNKTLKEANLKDPKQLLLEESSSNVLSSCNDCYCCNNLQQKKFQTVKRLSVFSLNEVGP